MNSKCESVAIMNGAFFTCCVLTSFCLQYFFGYRPCLLCFGERYLSVCAFFSVFFLHLADAKKTSCFVSVAFLMLLMLLFFAHIFVEKSLVTYDCNSNISSQDLEDLRQKLYTAQTPPCNIVSLKIFGLSLPTFGFFACIFVLFSNIKVFFVNKKKL